MSYGISDYITIGLEPPDIDSYADADKKYFQTEETLGKYRFDCHKVEIKECDDGGFYINVTSYYDAHWILIIDSIERGDYEQRIKDLRQLRKFMLECVETIGLCEVFEENECVEFYSHDETVKDIETVIQFEIGNLEDAMKKMDIVDGQK